MTKQYCGSAKTITTQYGDLMKLSFTEEDIKMLQENLSEGWVNAVVKQRKEPSKGGMTHYLEIDTWKPEKKEASEDEVDKSSDLPF